MYRFPKEDVIASSSFYERDYCEGMTTELPDPIVLQGWVKSGFAGTEKDISEKIRIVARLTSGRSILDYGCSWGYAVSQFVSAGFQATGYEIGLGRARYGARHLGLDIFTDRVRLLAERSGSFDVLFANHVLEHVAAPAITFADFRALVRPGGLVVGFMPNAGGEKAFRYGIAWGPLIGEKHPLAVDAKFLDGALRRYGFIPQFASSPYPTTGPALTSKTTVDALPGDELLVVAEKG